MSEPERCPWHEIWYAEAVCPKCVDGTPHEPPKAPKPRPTSDIDPYMRIKRPFN